MRRTILLASILQVAIVGSSAIAAEKPIPQDRAASERRRQARLDWNRRTLQGAYEKVGKRDPRWDAQVREALDLAARSSVNEIGREVTGEQVLKPAKAAIDAGCEDTLVVYLYHRLMLASDHPPEPMESYRQIRSAAKALEASRYPAIRKAIALHRAGSLALSIKDDARPRKQAVRDLDAAVALIAESVAGDERNEHWEDLWYLHIIGLIQDYRTSGLDAEAALGKLDAALGRHPELAALRYQVRGNFWLRYGWEARTNAVAVNVPAGGFELFHRRLEDARDAFKQAWAARPGDARTAVQMLEIEKSIGGDRDAMELWFARAMKADGDSYDACWSKLDWLDPKWHGNTEDMLAFGRACGATGNWWSGITLLLPEAHYRHVVLLEQAERPKYLGSPEVWAEIRAVYDEYLKHQPGDHVVRSKYALLGYFANKFAEAQVQFNAVGEHLTTWTTFPYPPMSELLRIKADNARLAALGPGPVGWNRFQVRNDGGTWSVMVPAKPARRQEKGILGADWRNIFTTAAGGITYTVRVQPVPADALGKDPRPTLEAARDEVAREHDGRVRDERRIAIGEHPAIDFLIDAPKLRPSIVHVRQAVIGNKLYEISVIAPEKDMEGPLASGFLKSFVHKLQ